MNLKIKNKIISCVKRNLFFPNSSHERNYAYQTYYSQGANRIASWQKENCKDFENADEE